MQLSMHYFTVQLFNMVGVAGIVLATCTVHVSAPAPSVVHPTADQRGCMQHTQERTSVLKDSAARRQRAYKAGKSKGEGTRRMGEAAAAETEQ